MRPDDRNRPLLTALDELEAMVTANAARNQAALSRIAEIRAGLAAGRSIAEVEESEDAPLVVELITANIDGLFEVGARFRRAEVAALRAEGYTMQRIADLFGITRQRVSAIIKSAADS